MGGLMILFGLFVSALLWANLESPYVWIVLFVTAGFAAIGFYDDYLKVTKQSHLGFSGRARLAAEYVIAALACYAMMRVGATGATSLAVPFVSGYVFDFGWAFLLFGPFVIVAFGNAVNLTDGLDGLAIVPVMIAGATLGLIAYLAGSAIYSHYLLINHVPACRRSDGGLRRDDRGRSRVPVVQRPAGPNFHGRYRIAGAWRPARRHGGRGQARNRAGGDRRPVRHGGAIGHCAGRLVQAHRQARISRWRRSIIISSSLDGRSRRSSCASGSSPSCWRWSGSRR